MIANGRVVHPTGDLQRQATVGQLTADVAHLEATSRGFSNGATSDCRFARVQKPEASAGRRRRRLRAVMRVQRA